MCDTREGKCDAEIRRGIKIEKVAFQKLCNVFSDIKYLLNRKLSCDALLCNIKSRM